MADQVATSVVICLGLLSLSPMRRSRREAVAGEGLPFGKKTAEVVLRPGRLGGPSLRRVCLVNCIGSLQEKVVGVAAKRMMNENVYECRLNPPPQSIKPCAKS